MSDDNNLTAGERERLVSMSHDITALASDPADLAMIESYRFLLQRDISASAAFDATSSLRRSLGRLKKGPAPGTARVGSADRRQV